MIKANTEDNFQKQLIKALKEVQKLKLKTNLRCFPFTQVLLSALSLESTL